MIALLKYNAGNLRSVKNALDRLGVESEITNEVGALRQADKVIIPGVGQANTAMQYLEERGLDQVIKALNQPVLGICLGLQLMCSFSEEGATSCLDIFPQQVKKFIGTYKVPHMGWNTCFDLKGPLFNEVDENSDLYFVHSYFAEISECTTAKCTYGQPFTAAMRKDNFYAVQFHPEKSSLVGAQLLKNFLEL